MSPPTLEEIADRGRALRELADSVSFDVVAASLDRGLEILGELPGDPDRVEQFAAVFRGVGADLTAVGDDVAGIASGWLVAWWSGEGGTRAAAATAVAARTIASTVPTLTAAGAVLVSLADSLREARRTQFVLRDAMAELRTFAGTLTGPEAEDPVLRVQVVETASRLLTDGGRLLETLHAVEAEAVAVLGRALSAPATVTPDGRRPLEEILTEYQISEDPDGTVMYPPWPYSLAVTPREITLGEKRLLDALFPWDKKDFADIRDAAYNASEIRYEGRGGEDGHQDAFRHGYWNALMAQRFGADWAQQMATAHERIPGNPEVRRAMDLHNNEIGRQIAVANPHASPEELADLVEQAVTEGRMVVVTPDRGLSYSDQIGEGATGRADDPPPETAEESGHPVPTSDDVAGLSKEEGVTSRRSRGYDVGDEPDTSTHSGG